MNTNPYWQDIVWLRG